MNRIYCDSDNVEWMLFDVNGQRCPSYDTPLHTDIFDYMGKHLSIEHCDTRCIGLPYFSVPMWVVDEADITSVLNCLYCVCCECGSVLNTPGQVMIIFTIGIDPMDNVTCMTWRTGLRGLCCNPNLLENSVYFPLMLTSQKKLIQTIENGWSSFNTERVCTGCEHWECKLTDKLIVQHNLYASVADQLLWHFFDIKLDVVTPLILNKCAKVTCGIPLKYCKDPIICDICRIKVYCSDKCIENHYCKPYYLLWI